MAYLIDRIKESFDKQGFKSTHSRRALTWLRAKIGTLNPTKQSLFADRKRLKNGAIIGKMYFYSYDPKTKDKLNYYDTFPLVIPIEQYTDGFLGLNLHYIHPKQRIVLLDKLSDFATNTKYDDKTKLRLSYALLSNLSKTYEHNPCIKRYLYSHIKSRFLEITADEWDIAVLLPVESFVGSSKNKVFSESRKKF